MKRSEVIGILNKELSTKHGGNYIQIARDCMDIIDAYMTPKFSGKHQSSYDIAMGNALEWDFEDED